MLNEVGRDDHVKHLRLIADAARGIITARHSGSRIRGKAEIQTKENEAREGQEAEGMPATIRLHVVGEEG